MFFCRNKKDVDVQKKSSGVAAAQHDIQTKKDSAQKTVFVGLSGGVDSSVSAYLLKEQGYNVVGVFIKTWQPDFIVCEWGKERIDAMRVAAHLDIPFLTCDAEEAYRTGVAEYMIEEYRRGNTPNPDVMCNREVKFGIFWDFAQKYGADYIATGHYAQIHTTINNTPILSRGKDTNKDQSYFLWTLTADDLAHTIFPVGHLDKDDTRRIAEEAELPVAQKKDSQGICFLGAVDMGSFLHHYVPQESGDVLALDGTVIGRHTGAIAYTLGQRHGFTVTNHGVNDAPLFVVAKDMVQNTITVAAKVEQVSKKDELVLTYTNIREPLPEKLSAQFRYRQTPFAVSLKKIDDEYVVVPEEVVEKPAAGQSCVLYNGDYCLGGGVLTQR